MLGYAIFMSFGVYSSIMMFFHTLISCSSQYHQREDFMKMLMFCYNSSDAPLDATISNTASSVALYAGINQQLHKHRLAYRCLEAAVNLLRVLPLLVGLIIYLEWDSLIVALFANEGFAEGYLESRKPSWAQI